MIVAITGSEGFLGWHVRCAALARGIDVIPINRTVMNDPGRFSRALRGADSVIHLAGVNRGEGEVVRAANARLGALLVSALESSDTRAGVVYGNSTQCGNGSPFGDGKAAAAAELADWAQRKGSAYVDLRLPNIFGEHGRPDYNSVFATFSQRLWTGSVPELTQDRELTLLPAQDAADLLLDLAESPGGGISSAGGVAMTVSELLRTLTEMLDEYLNGTLPPLATPFEAALFNAFRSYGIGRGSVLTPVIHRDARGHLFECLRAISGQSQVFISSTRPGITRGNHFHRRKVERFAVLNGSGVIRLRRVLTSTTIDIAVSGSAPMLVDIPTLWTHSIENVGDQELLTLFWSNELYDSAAADTTACSVLDPTDI